MTHITAGFCTTCWRCMRGSLASRVCPLPVRAQLHSYPRGRREQRRTSAARSAHERLQRVRHALAAQRAQRRRAQHGEALGRTAQRLVAAGQQHHARRRVQADGALGRRISSRLQLRQLRLQRRQQRILPAGRRRGRSGRGSRLRKPRRQRRQHARSGNSGGRRRRRQSSRQRRTRRRRCWRVICNTHPREQLVDERLARCCVLWGGHVGCSVDSGWRSSLRRLSSSSDGGGRSRARLGSGSFCSSIGLRRHGCGGGVLHLLRSDECC